MGSRSNMKYGVVGKIYFTFYTLKQTASWAPVRRGGESWNSQTGWEERQLNATKHLSENSGMSVYQNEHHYIFSKSIALWRDLLTSLHSQLRRLIAACWHILQIDKCEYGKYVNVENATDPNQSFIFSSYCVTIALLGNLETERLLQNTIK